MSAPDRTMLLDPAHPILSIRRQCGLLGLARSGVYRPARIANDDELAIRRRWTSCSCSGRSSARAG